MNIKKESFGKFDFVGKINLFGGISIAFVALSFAYLMWHGISWGIDFVGGTELQVKFSEPVSIEAVRKNVDSLGLLNPSIQGFATGDEYVIRFQMPKMATEKETNIEIQKSVQKLKDSVNTNLAASKPEFRRVDSVGPQVGAELKKNGFLSVFYCLLVILIYIGLRFDYKYAPGAVICLFHDAVITLAIFVFVGKEINIPVLAAILTLIGYSLNDTIVVFDRVRETEHLFHGKGIKFVINKAINDMLERTLITSGTVLTSALALWFFADGTVSDICFALSIGIIFGTYSSIYVAAPFVIFLDQSKKA